MYLKIKLVLNTVSVVNKTKNITKIDEITYFFSEFFYKIQHIYS